MQVFRYTTLLPRERPAGKYEGTTGALSILQLLPVRAEAGAGEGAIRVCRKPVYRHTTVCPYTLDSVLFCKGNTVNAVFVLRGSPLVDT